MTPMSPERDSLPAGPLNVSRLKAIVDTHMHVDAAHDWSHVERVWWNAVTIAQTEPATDWLVLQPAVFLHDVGDKVPDQGNALLDADFVAELLQPMDVPMERVPAIVAAINAHSFSRGLPPPSLEAAILQDADRLDAIGAIGVARCFATGGARGRPLRESIDHFYDKLLTLRDGMHTAEGRRRAEARHAFLEQFLEQFWREWPAEN